METNFHSVPDCGEPNTKKIVKHSAKPSQQLYKPPVLRYSQRKIQKLAKKTKSEPKGQQNETLAHTQADFDDEEHVDFDELMVSLKQLLDKEMDRVGNFLAPKLIKNAELAHLIGEFLTKYVIEDAQQQSRRRRASNVIGQVVGQLSGGSVGQEAFLEGICDTLERYWECRDMLRNSTEEEQSKAWTNLLSLIFDLGAQQMPRYKDRLIELIFAIFEYLFSDPVLCSLRISELESVLSALMILGRSLELEHPAKMGDLKASLRDAFLALNEPWVRKMVLLMVELGANGWRLSDSLEQYYFH